MEYWQVAAGSEGRDYWRDFLRYGMAFVGGRQQTELMRLVKAGDCVVLKEGLRKIIAAGRVVKREGRHSGHAVQDEDPTKQWLLHYDGWHLPAYCYVDWRCPPSPIETRGLVRAAIRRVDDPDVRQAANTILSMKDAISPPPEPEPCPVQNLPPDWMSTLLQARSVETAQEIRRYLARLKRLAPLYEEQWEEVREHETRTFLVVPFLLALGWKEEQLKIELPVKLPKRRGRIDVACFRDLPSRRIAMVIETKGYSQGLSSAREQVTEYATSVSSSLAIASNGYTYQVYRQVEVTAGARPKYVHAAYLNLLRPTTLYPLAPTTVAGAAEALGWLLPPG